MMAAVGKSGPGYLISVNGTGSGTFDLVLHEWQNETMLNTILYKDVPVNPNTKARSSYLAGSTTLILEVDENGDGVFEMALPPSSILGSQGETPDTQPPSTRIQLSGEGANGLYKSDVTVTLSAADEANGTGVLKTTYTLNGGQTLQTYTGPFVISSEGAWTIMAQSSDRAGNIEATLVSTTIQIDKTPPILNVSVTPNVLWPPNHKMVTVLITKQATDNFDPNPMIKLVSVTSNEPAPNGQTDVIIKADGTVQLRAERLGNGTGRVYTLTYSAQDTAGNIALKNVTVTVPHNR